jgi:hypothetical protein
MHCAKPSQFKQTNIQPNFSREKQKKWEANKPRKRLYFFFAAFFLVFLAALGTILTSKQ